MWMFLWRRIFFSLFLSVSPLLFFLLRLLWDWRERKKNICKASERGREAKSCVKFKCDGSAAVPQKNGRWEYCPNKNLSFLCDKLYFILENSIGTICGSRGHMLALEALCPGFRSLSLKSFYILDSIRALISSASSNGCCKQGSLLLQEAELSSGRPEVI